MVNSRHSTEQPTSTTTAGSSTSSGFKTNTMLNGTDSATVKRDLDQLLETYDDDGEHLLKELPLYILEVEKKIPTIFTLTGDVIEVEESFAAEECSASGIRSGKPNLRVVEAGKAVAREIDIAIDRLSRLQRFVLMHVPKEEDGNNFGVAVQGQFYSKLSKYLKWCDAIQDEGKSYHHSRADILRRMELDEKLEYRETVCEKEDKVTKSKATKTVANVPHIGDLTCYLARHDALQFFTLKNIMQGLISMYVHCYVYVKNNYEKIRWPRGRSEGLNMHMY